MYRNCCKRYCGLGGVLFVVKRKEGVRGWGFMPTFLLKKDWHYCYMRNLIKLVLSGITPTITFSKILSLKYENLTVRIPRELL